MGFEISYSFHPRNEDGTYNKEVVEEKTKRVGKSFDDTPLEKCAAAIMAQLARRDVWVIDVEVSEFVKKKVSFKESKDGNGIVLKNKKFSLGGTAELVEEVGQVAAMVPANPNQHPHELIKSSSFNQNTVSTAHPHEQIKIAHDEEAALYAGGGNVTTGINPRSVNQNRTLYEVIFSPSLQHQPITKRLKLKLQINSKYKVHANNGSNIAITDDTGNVLVVDQRFFDAAPKGLVGDSQLGFSDPVVEAPRPKLMHEDDMHVQHHQMPNIHEAAASSEMPALREENASPPPEVSNIPIDNGTIPASLLEMPKLR